jgi:hypothetical protein
MNEAKCHSFVRRDKQQPESWNVDKFKYTDLYPNTKKN